MARRHYSELDRAAALASLAAHSGDLAATVKATGIPESTLRRWGRLPACQPSMGPSLAPSAGSPAANAQGLTPNAQGLPWENGAPLYDQLAGIADCMCAALLERLAEATFPQLCTALGMVMDRMAVLQTQEDFTQEWMENDDAELAHLSDEECTQIVNEILDAARARKAAPHPGENAAPPAAVRNLAGADLPDVALGLAPPAPPPVSPGPVDLGRDLSPHGLHAPPPRQDRDGHHPLPGLSPVGAVREPPPQVNGGPEREDR